MGWSKGAVVIIKHGDKEMADAIENGIHIKKATDKEIEELKKQLKEEKRKNDLTSIHDNRVTNERIAGLNNNAVSAKKHCLFIQWIIGGFALLIYGFSLFVDKYLIIRE